MKVWRLVAGLIGLSLSCNVQAAQYSLTSELTHSNDSDGAEQTMFGIGSEVLVNRRTETKASILAGGYSLKDDSGSKEFNILRLKGQSALSELVKINLRALLYQGSDWSPVAFGGTAAFNPVKSLHLELFTDRAIVDSLLAVEAKYYVDTYGISADYLLLKELTIVGAGYRQNITDGNNRHAGIIKLIYSPRQYDWLNLSAYGKIVTSDFRGTGYFSPERLKEYMIIAGFSKPLLDDAFVVKARVGIGNRKIDGDTNTLSLYELKMKGWAWDRLGVELTGGHTNDSGTFGRYSRNYLTLTAQYMF